VTTRETVGRPDTGSQVEKKVLQCWFVTVCPIEENGRRSPIFKRSPRDSVFSPSHYSCAAASKIWELRATTILTHLWRRHGKSVDDHWWLYQISNLLADRCDTNDLQEATALLYAVVSERGTYDGNADSHD